jgi:hypothetical protein
MDAGGAARRAVLTRTAKSCGLDTTMPVSKSVGIPAEVGGNRARLTGESTKETVKTIRVRECRVVPVDLW